MEHQATVESEKQDMIKHKAVQRTELTRQLTPVKQKSLAPQRDQIETKQADSIRETIDRKLTTLQLDPPKFFTKGEIVEIVTLC